MIWMIASAMIDLMPRAHGLPGIADTDLRGFLKRMRKEADWLYFLGLVVAALVYQATPLFTVYVPLPAALLPRGLRARHAEIVIGSRVYALRQMIYLLRLSAGMCWGMDPDVRRRFALRPYDPDPGTFRTSS